MPISSSGRIGAVNPLDAWRLVDSGRRVVVVIFEGVIVAIDHVQLAAPPGCEAAARAFYGSVLGLEEVEKPAPLKARGGCWFQCGSQQLHIGIARDFKPATKAHPAFAVTDLDILRTALTAVGAPVIADENHPGTCRFYTEDPWGNRLEFLESDRGMRKVEG